MGDLPFSGLGLGSPHDTCLVEAPVGTVSTELHNVKAALATHGLILEVECEKIQHD